MDLFHAIALGIIKGLTEFLPISSSGHLVLGKVLFGFNDTRLIFEVFVHFGTVLSVIVAFYKDIGDLITSFFRGLIHPGQWKSLWTTDESFRLSWLILLGIIPAGVIGLLVEGYVTDAFSNPTFVGFTLLITALILWTSRFANPEDAPVNWKRSIIIGFAQALAIIPGISRSGTTITAGLWLRLSAESAAKFSFFLAIPVILGASLMKLFEIFTLQLTGSQLVLILAGTIAAFLSGWIAIIFLMDTLRKGKFSWFALYCLVIGLVTIFITTVL